MFDEIRAVIFDLDGTLADSMGIWRDIDIEYLGRFQIPLPERLQQEIEGMSFTETACYFKERFRIPDRLEEIKAEWNRMARAKYENDVPLKPGAEDFLKQCRNNGYKLGIATSNSRELVDKFIGKHCLEDCFHTILTACDVRKGKPSPDIYLRAAEQLATEPEHCLVFEDIVPGILAGKSAGMRVCAVEDAYSAYQRKEKRELADYYIESYRELLEQNEGEAV